MSAETEGYRILYLGNGKPGAELLRQNMLDSFKRPVFLHHARTAEDPGALPDGFRVDAAVVSEVPGGRSALGVLGAVLDIYPGVPVLCLTDTPEEAAALVAAGAADCLEPDDAARLSFAVWREIERSKRVARRVSNRPADFVGMLLTIAGKFTSVPSERLMDALCGVMELVSAYCGADKVVSFLFDWENGTAVRHYEWNILPEYHSADRGKIVPLSDFGDVLDCFKQNKPYIKAGPDSIPDDIWHDAQTGSDDASSVCAAPAYLNGKLKGLIALVTVGRRKSWTDDEITAFYICVEIVVSMMLRVDDEPAFKAGWAVPWASPNCTPTGFEDRNGDVEALRQSEFNARALIRELEAAQQDLKEEVEALRLVHDIGSTHMHLNDLNYIYKEILNAAVHITHTDKGSIRILVENESCLKVVASVGLNDAFISGFAVVPLGEQNPSGRALARRARVLSKPSEEEFLIAWDKPVPTHAPDIRFMQVTPIIGSSGTLFGTLNTYYSQVHDFSECEQRHLDLLASMVADFIERKRYEVALEISERNAKALVEALQRADRSKNEFLNQLSHELRNPLATINAAIALIQISDGLPQIHQTAEILRTETRQLGRLVEDLLDVTRITTNKIRLKRSRIDLAETVRTSAGSFGPRFREKNVHLTSEISGTPILLLADPARITQIVENLLTNALKYTDEGGDIVLSLHEEDGTAVLSVTDSGIGVRPEELPLLFNAFYQAEKPPERPDSGLGLGLAVVKSITELHGGSVSAYSRGPGTGATFTVTLPIGDTTEPEFDGGK